MDDTAFHYSRTLRIIMVLAIVLPIIGIGCILWYFGAGDSGPTSDATGVSAEEELEEEADPEAGGNNIVGSAVSKAANNPLRPIGPGQVTA